MSENKKEMSNKEFAIGCIGLIAVLGLVLFLFMGCMAKMTEQDQPSKEQKEIEDTNKRLEEKAEKTEKANSDKTEKISETDIEDFKDTVQRRLDQNGLDNYVTKVDNPKDDTISYYVSNDVKQLTKKEKENLSTNISEELQGAALATYLGGNKKDAPFIDGFYESKEPFSRTTGLDKNKFSVIN